MIPRVTPGVFFDRPATLPRGRHSMAPEEVAEAQRERLMVAATELLADVGHGGMRTGEVAKHAGVSLQTFYAIFPDKESCIFAAYERFIEVLLRRVGEGLDTSGTWHDFLQAAVESYLGTLAADLVVARAFQVEMDALGAQARARRRQALRRFAAVMTAAQDQLAAIDDLLDPPPFNRAEDIHLASIYAARQLASDALETEQRPDFEGLAQDMTACFVAALYGGPPLRASALRRDPEPQAG